MDVGISSIVSSFTADISSFMTGYCIQSFSYSEIFKPLKSSFLPSKYAHNVFTNSDLPNRLGREKKTNFLLPIISYIRSVLSTYKKPSLMIDSKSALPVGYLCGVAIMIPS